MTAPVARPLRVLILGGTGEALGLARALADDARVAPILSLAGRTKAPVLPPIPYRIGGFGGAAGLATYLADQAIDLLIDATHPFAAQITRNAAAAVENHPIPLLRLDRPDWQPVGGDCWTMVGTMDAAAAALGGRRRRVFLTIGQQELAPFCAAPWHDYVIRSVDPPAIALQPSGSIIMSARGPFDEAGEVALLRHHRIEVLVTKNSGGSATAAKLAAARALGLPVIMVARPKMPRLETVADVPAVLVWLEVHHDAATRRGV